MKSKLHFLVFAVILAGMVFFSCSFEEPDYAGILASMPAADIGRTGDGVYEGSHYLFPVDVIVSVKVASGRIEKIDLIKHFNGKGKPAEAIILKVMEAQSLNVDTITGATHSSVTILKAIANAIEKGENHE